jgi:hypothetical protein
MKTGTQQTSRSAQPFHEVQKCGLDGRDRPVDNPFLDIAPTADILPTLIPNGFPGTQKLNHNAGDSRHAVGAIIRDQQGTMCLYHGAHRICRKGRQRSGNCLQHVKASLL